MRRPWTPRLVASLVLLSSIAAVTTAHAAPNAIRFNGSTQYVTFGGATNQGARTFTVECWFRREGAGTPTSTGAGGVAAAIPLLAKGRADADGNNRDVNYFLGIRSDSILVADFEEMTPDSGGTTAGLNHPIAGITVIRSHVWYHAAVTFDGTRFRLFLDGVTEKDTLLGPNRFPRYTSVEPLSIGSALTQANVAGGFFQGCIDAPRIWNVARAQQGIRDSMYLPLTTAPGLIGHWALDEGTGNTTVSSTVAGAPNGTLVASPTWLLGGAIGFAGTSTVNGYVNLGNPAALQLAEFTLEAWIRRDGAGIGTDTGNGGIPDLIPLIAKGRAESENSQVDINYLFGIRASDGLLCVDFEEAAGGSAPGQNHPVLGANPITNGVWRHVAATYDGNRMKIYVNGNVERDTLIGEPVNADNTGPASIASALRSTSVAAGFFNGAMDEVRVWNRARLQSEIIADLNAQITTARPNLVARWAADDASGKLLRASAGTTANGDVLGPGFNWTGPAPFNAAPPAAPNAPTGLSATGRTYASIRLAWTDASSNEAGFKIFRSVTGVGGPFDSIGTAAANATSFDDVGLAPNTQYCYQVRSFNGIGTSSPTTAQCATTLIESERGLALNGTDAYVTFGNQPALGLAQFTLECWFRREVGGTTASTGANGVTAWPLITKGVGEVDAGDDRDLNYFLGIRSTDSVLVADFEEGAAGSSPSLNHFVVGATSILPGTWHHAAAAYDGNKWQLFLDGNLERELVVGEPVRDDSRQHSAIGSALTSSGGAQGFFSGRIDEARIWNVARSITDIQSTINQALSAPTTGLVGRWGLNEGADSTVFGGAGTGNTGHARGGYTWITPGSPFDAAAPTAPGAPTNLVAQQIGEGQIQLTWTDGSTNELTFDIERSTTGSGGPFTPLASVTANERIYIDTGLLENSEYCYQVRATNNVSSSTYAGPACATTPAAPNRAIDFGGANAYVTFGDPVALRLPQFTLECWFRRDGSGATATTGAGGVVAVPLITKGVAESDSNTRDVNYFLGIRSGDNVLVADFEEGRLGSHQGVNHPIAGATSILNNTWYHAAVTYDGNKWQLFLNGNLERELTVGEPPQNLSIQLAALGSALTSTNVASGFFDGPIDEARVWDYARTPVEINGTINSQITAAQSGLVARWGLNEGTNIQVHSSAGTNVPGTIAGTTWSWTTPGAPFNVPPQSPPNAPSNFVAFALNHSQVKMDWVDESTNELGFEIERSLTGPGGTFTPLVTVPVNTTTWIDGGLDAVTQYCYRIRAISSAGPSSTIGPECATTPVEPNNALDLDGSAGYVTFGDPNALDLEEFTVETWFRRDGAGVSNSTGSGGVDAIPLVTHGTSEVDEDDSRDMNFYLGIRAADNVLCADFEEGAGQADPGLNHPVFGQTAITNGTWHHAAVSYDGTKWRLYLDGTLEAEDFVGQKPRSNTIQRAALGTGIQSDDVAEGFFAGAFDEARIWDHARTESEIQADINAQIRTPRTGLVARWGLNEGTGSSVGGSAGTAITGNIVGTQGTNFTWTAGAPFNIVIQHPPMQPTNPFPSDGATQVPTSTNLSLRVDDLDPGNLNVTFYGRAVAAAAGPDFTLGIIPDTQFYTASANGGTPAMFDAQTNWIVANKSALNIVDVIQLGDCTNNGDSFQQEWINADHSMRTIEDSVATGLRHGLPYSICVGNHDQSPNGDAAGSTTFYNQYFGSARFAGRPYYGGHYGTNNDNHYHLFEASGMKFIVISFEYDTSPDIPVLDWADNLLTTFSDRRAIIASHSIIGAGNPATFSSQGQAIYNRLRTHENLFLMLCGHVSPPEGRRSDTFQGRTVYSIMTDYQGRTRGGDGWLRYYQFSPANNVIRARTYSPTLGQFETDADSSSQFTIPYDMGGGAAYQVIGTPQTVAAGSVASVSWNGLTAANQYDWYAVVTDATNRTTTSETYRFTTQDNVLPVVQVLAPNGGESWRSGTHHNITWTATDNSGTVESVDIAYSTNGGTSYPNVVATGLSNSGTFDWVVPETVTGTARVRVTARDVSGNAGNDASNANFTITDGAPPVVNVTSPDGGESWLTGSIHPITWTATDNVAVTTVDLAYSTNGGTSFTNITTGIANSGSFNWTLPTNVASSTARVRVLARDAAANVGRDSSATNFAIVDGANPVVTLTVPNGGEVWGVGTVHNVTWTATDNIGVTGVDLAFTTTGGSPFANPIATGLTNTGTFAWTVPNNVSTTVKLLVTARDASGRSASDSSNANFTITPDPTPPTVTVTAPNTAVSWASNTHHNITWTASDNISVANVDIAYSNNGGTSFPNVIASAVPNTGTFDWLVPGALIGNTMRVQVTARDGGGNTASDASNVNFTITDGTPPLVDLTAPNGGEIWNIGSTQNITWSATDNVAVTTVDFAVSTNGGTTFTNIATAQPNAGTRTWTVPNTPSTTARIRIIGRDAAGNTARDSSAANFTIADTSPPVVTLTSPNGGENWAAASVHAVTWTATDNVGVTGVDLAYSSDGGATFPNAIATNIANSGTFNWTVPGTLGSSYRVRVTARDAGARAASDTSNANFNVVPEAVLPVVTVTAPNTAVSWVSGSHHNITWTATDNSGTVASIDLAYSTNGGTTYPNVIATGLANSGTFDWTVPSIVTTTARVQVIARDPSGNAGSDGSNVNFTITDGIAPSADLTSPNGGESFNVGSTQAITWSASDDVAVTSVDLAYSTNGGTSFTNVIATGIANSGSFNWTVPSIATTTARVRVIARDAAGNTARDSSAANFSIVDVGPPLATLTSPNGGENWGAGSVHAVTWTATDNVGVTAIDLAYSNDGGATFPNAIATGIANSGSFNWTVPATLGSTYRVRVTARDGSANETYDTSNGDFSIVPEAVLPVVTVTSPNTAVSWRSGTHQNITWTATDNSGTVASVDLAYSTNGGTSYPNVIATGLSNTGTFDWTVPENFTTTARVQVIARDPSGNAGSDVSNVNFSITDGVFPTADLTSPDGGESWAVGSVHAVTWSASDNVAVTAVDLALSTNGGTSFTNIATNLANSGSFNWTVPGPVTTTARIRVIARDAAGNAARDSSAANFSIVDNVPPLVTLSSPNGGESWATGSTQSITWSASDNVGVTAIDLAYSTDGGGTYPNVIATGIANTGTRTWTVPGTASTTLRVRVAARDAAGNETFDVSNGNFSAIVDPDLVSNGGFESNINGWTNYSSATLTQGTEGHTGTRSLRIQGSSSSSFGCDDLPNMIAPTASRGAVYRISAWVKRPTGATGSAGQVKIRIYEYVGSSQQGSTAYSQVLNLTTGWQQLFLNYTVRAANSYLSMRVTDEPAASNEVFLVDDVSIKLQSGSTPPDAAPVVVAPTTRSATAGQQLQFTVTASDADGPAIASLTQTGKPAAATFVASNANQLGTFTWTPTAADVRAAPYVVIFTASNTKSGLDTTSITVGPAGDAAPVVNAPSSVSGRPGVPITFNVTASDADGPPWTLSQSGMPAGASFVVNGAQTSGAFSWTPTAGDVRAAPYQITFTATNSRVTSVTTNITVSNGPPELCGNPGFENGLTGWGTYGDAALAVVSGGRSGNALRITGSDSHGCDDIPNWVSGPLQRNAVYRVSCWVKSTTGATGQVKIRVYEYVGSSQQGSTAYSNQPDLTSNWQQLTIDYTVRTAGSYLSIRVTDAPDGSNEVWLVDDVSITQVGGATAVVMASTEGAAIDTAPIVAETSLRFGAAVSPNPMRTEGTLSFVTTRPGSVRVALYGVDGRRVIDLMDEPALAAGRHALTVRGTNAGRALPAGLYFYRVEAAEGVLTGRFVLMK